MNSVGNRIALAAALMLFIVGGFWMLASMAVELAVDPKVAAATKNELLFPTLLASGALGGLAASCLNDNRSFLLPDFRDGKVYLGGLGEVFLGSIAAAAVLLVVPNVPDYVWYEKIAFGIASGLAGASLLTRIRAGLTARVDSLENEVNQKYQELKAKSDFANALDSYSRGELLDAEESLAKVGDSYLPARSLLAEIYATRAKNGESEYAPRAMEVIDSVVDLSGKERPWYLLERALVRHKLGQSLNDVIEDLRAASEVKATRQYIKEKFRGIPEVWESDEFKKLMEI